MRIDALKPSAAELPILLPGGEATGITLNVIGHDSKRFRDVAKRYAQQMLGASDKPDIELLEKQNAELTAACVVGWSGLEDEHGNPLPYSPERALELLAMPELTYMREQVETYVSKRANFFRHREAAA